MSFRVLLDEDVNVELGFALRRAGYDAIHIQEVGRKGKPDDEQLVYALKERRAILTHNVRDFVPLHNDYCYSLTEHYGVIVAKRMSISLLFHLMDKILTNESESTIRNTLRYI